MLVRLRPSVALTVTVIATLLGCAHGAARSTGMQVASGASTISRSEIDSLMVQYPNAFDLIRSARPAMLVSRDIRLPYPVREGVQSDPSGVKVFVDEVYAGGIEMLRRLPSRSIIFVQHLSPSDATKRTDSRARTKPV
jgi:hypothetical protein